MGVRWSRMSWSERNELWMRWRRGESLREIAHGLRRASSVIYTVVAVEGGIPPRPRATRPGEVADVGSGRRIRRAPRVHDRYSCERLLL